jgi:hypothetical protein
MYFTNLENTILVQANNSKEGLQKLGYVHIYLEKNRYYALDSLLSKTKIFLHKARVYKNKNSYTLDCGIINSLTNKEKLVKFDKDFKFIKELIY